MILRTLALVNQYGLDRRKILLLTFTRKAARELEDRISEAFARQDPTQDLGLPKAKTFHSLAYSWVWRFWKSCGLRKAPSLLIDNDRKKFMKTVIESLIRSNQLKWCHKHFGKELGLPSNRRRSWKALLSAMKENDGEHRATFLSACLKAKSLHGEKRKTKTAKMDKDAGEKRTAKSNEKNQQQEELLVLPETWRQCYLALRQTKMEAEQDCPNQVFCPYENMYSEEKESFWLEVIDKARLGQHDPSEYLPREANVIKRYERMQDMTDQVDFDKLLALFSKLLQSEDLRNLFHRSFEYVIVDEFQDNSAVQSSILFDIVKGSRITVVGDDDQCIYAFRGASPGNFEAFVEHFSAVSEDSGKSSTADKALGPVLVERLEENYRSTGNILQTGTKFLKDVLNRTPKLLNPTRETGAPVELWTCDNSTSQAARIAESIKNRHEMYEVEWQDVACLFRCFKMGPRPPLHMTLQQEFSKRGIPFQVAKGNSFLESEVVRDVLAYVQLSVGNGTARGDDVAFMRVLNKPTRGIGPKLQKLIKAHQTNLEDSRKGGSVGNSLPSAEEAARALCIDIEMLKKPQRQNLEKFLNFLQQLRVKAVRTELYEFINYVWHETGLGKLHDNKAQKDHKAPNQRRVYGGNNKVVNNHDCMLPDNFKILLNVAEAFVAKAKYNETDSQNGVASLFELTKRFIMSHPEKLLPLDLPQIRLPRAIIEDLTMPRGVGLFVIIDFLDSLHLDVIDDEEVNMDNNKGNRVTISTIHRAKGLEWKEVYVPYFNEEYMPTSYREVKDEDPKQRHQHGCAKQYDRDEACTMECSLHFKELERRRLGLTPQESHGNEERRLAHVAATRARDRLVFVENRESGRSSLRQYVPQPQQDEINFAESDGSAFDEGDEGDYELPVWLH